MLRRDKFLQEFVKLKDRLFPDLSSQTSQAMELWKKLCGDETALSRVEELQHKYSLPGWVGNLGDTYTIDQSSKNYCVLAVDGSQIYPDRHMPSGTCFLINIGGMMLSYGLPSNVEFFSEPYLFLPEDLDTDAARSGFSAEMVDFKREELEFSALFKHASACTFDDILSLVDGSIIFWHLESKSPRVRDHFLGSYLYYLQRFYERKRSIAGYISLPKSRDLVNLLKMDLCHCSDMYLSHGRDIICLCSEVEHLIDSRIMSSVLPVYHRSTLFWSNSKIIGYYPTHLKPYFFYLNIGPEIVRIEIPAWIAQDEQLVGIISCIALNQAIKGGGYPICLAESHEQAVIKGADREFFYHVLSKYGIESRKQLSFSQKSLKKRGIGV